MKFIVVPKLEKWTDVSRCGRRRPLGLEMDRSDLQPGLPTKQICSKFLVKMELNFYVNM